VKSVVATALASVVLLWSSVACAHDASAWGGLFRSSDQGASWFLASPGTYPTAAIAVAVSPTDGNHLLLATDSGLLRSRNGSRDWSRETPSVLSGAVWAAAFAADGRRALIATDSGVFRSEADNDWRPARAPRGAVPARVIAPGAVPGRAYLAGWTGFVRTDDWGGSWTDAAAGLPDAPVTSVLVIPDRHESVHVVVADAVWSTQDGARTWVKRETGPGGVDALGRDVGDAARLWAARGPRLLVSDDGGMSWRPAGAPLPEANASVRGISAMNDVIVVATDRGLFRSTDGAKRWVTLEGNLPAHLEAGPLVRDPSDPERLYVGFSVTPYSELWRRAVDGVGVWQRIDLASLLGAVAFVILVGVLGTAAVWRLWRHRRAEPIR
jgi:photosystem II stability/assembly factor-like uncharacterized protein